MKKRGFTLIELLGVIIILSVVITLVTPKIIEQIKESNKSTNEYTKKYVVASAERYIKDYTNDYPRDEDATYCVPIKTLADLDYVKSPVLLDKEDITSNYVVKVTYDNKFMYEIVQDIDCHPTEGTPNSGSDIPNYSVGDTICVTLNGFTTTNDHSAEGCTSGQFLLRVANTTPCTTEQSQSACGTVLEFVDVITTHRMNPYTDGSTDGDGNKGGWASSEMRTYINSTIYNALPSDLKSKIINTQVVSSHGLYDAANFTSTDKLYLLSPVEIYGSSFTNSYDTSIASSRQLDYYKNAGVTTSNYSGAIKKLNGSAQKLFLRSAISSSNRIFYAVYASGDWNNDNSHYAKGVSPAFRIG